MKGIATWLVIALVISFAVTGAWRWLVVWAAAGLWLAVLLGLVHEMGRLPHWTPRWIMDLLDRYTQKAPLLKAIEAVQRSEMIDAPAIAAAVKQKVIGQDAVADEVAHTIRRRLAMETRDKPVGVFCFAGPPGVGKTEMGKQLADALGRGFLMFDMSQYNHTLAANTLFGTAKGTIGSESWGELTAGLRDQPKALVLLDEFEKAIPDVMRRFLTAWNDGFITEASTGQRVATNQAIFVLTTNAASERIGKLAAEVTDRDQLVKASKAALQEAGFPPEVLSRIDRVFAFNHLAGADLARVCVVHILGLVGKYGLKLSDSGDGIAWELLLEAWQRSEHLQAAGGVREIIRAIEERICDGLIEAKQAGASVVRLVMDDLGGLLVEQVA